MQKLLLFIFGLLLLPVKTLAVNIYADGTLVSDCTSNYSIASRDCSGSDGNAFNTISEGVATMSPGDILLIRGGTYNEIQIALDGLDGGTLESPFIIRSYPGEWAIIDGQYGGSGNDQSVFQSLGGTTTYLTLERMEITGGGHATVDPYRTGDGIYINKAQNCTFRYLYVHDNYGNTENTGSAAGIHLYVGSNNNTIEYNYLKCNGEPDTHNSANCNIAIHSDQAYTNPVTAPMAKNIIRYNLIDGSCISGYTDTGIAHKGFQRLTGYKYGETENVADSTPNGIAYRAHGDAIHHNMILNHGILARLDQDYVQFYNNIGVIGNRTFTNDTQPPIELKDASGSDRRGSFWGCIYNNTLILSDTIAVGAYALSPENTWDCSVDGTSSDTDKFLISNNIFEGAYYVSYPAVNVGTEVYDTQSNCTSPQPIDLTDINLDRNFFFAGNGTNPYRVAKTDYSPAGIVATEAATDGWAIASPSPYLGESGANQYIADGSYSLAEGDTIGTSGVGGAHPYLVGITLPGYIGATNPSDYAWVTGVLALGTVYFTSQANGSDPLWLDGLGSDITAPVTTISQSDPTTVQAATVTLTGTASDAGGMSSCKWRPITAPDGANGTACSGSTSWSCNVTGLALGANTVYVGCVDPSGNWGSDSLTVNREAAAVGRSPIIGTPNGSTAIGATGGMVMQ